MIFVLSPDDNYVMPTGVLVSSICINNPTRHSFYFIGGNALLPNNIELLRKTILDYGSEAFFLDVPDTDSISFPVEKYGQPEYITKAAYYRLFVSKMLPPSIDKVIYLDGDIVCRSSLQDMWECAIDDSPMAAVLEIENGDDRYSRLGYDSHEGYYNSGVMLINLDYWRNNDVESVFCRFIREHFDLIRYHDQDVINAVFHGMIITLPLRFNVLNGYYVKDSFAYLYNEDEIRLARSNPSLVHFSSHLKPWYKGCSHPFSKEFLAYKKKTNWRRTRLKLFPTSSVPGFLSNLLVLIGIKQYNGHYLKLK